MIATHIFFLLIKVFVTYPFNKKSRIIVNSLLNNHSYRFPESMQGSFKAPFHYLRHSIFFIVKKKKTVYPKYNNNGIGVFDGNGKSLKNRFDYLNHLETLSPGFGIGRDQLYLQQKTAPLLYVLFLFVLVTPISLFATKRKGAMALVLLEFPEWVALTETLKKEKCKYLYHFCAYEKDSNFIAYLNLKSKIINHKVPSSNPLKNFYKYLICDTLAITAPFQNQEIDKLSINWSINKTIQWPIENFQNLIPYFNNNSNNKPQFDLAFLSSGIWLRQNQGHTPLGTGDQESELALMDHLKEYLTLNKNIRFLVLLHPIEKKSEMLYQAAINHYNALFNNIKVNFGDQDRNSFEYFSKSNLTIAAYSSTNLQRLFCGYKTLYAPLKFKINLYEHSAINNIAVKNKQELFELLNQSMKLSDKEFFELYVLKEYHHSNYVFKT
jgi:hypothetical protein